MKWPKMMLGSWVLVDFKEIIYISFYYIRIARTQEPNIILGHFIGRFVLSLNKSRVLVDIHQQEPVHEVGFVPK